MIRYARLALGLMMISAAVFAAPFASAQERLRPVGTITFTPEPIELQTDVFALTPENRRISVMRIEAREGAADIRDVRLIYRNGEQERIRVREKVPPGGMTKLIRKQYRGPLREVEVSYVPQGKVTLVLRADQRLTEPVAEWAELGCKSVGFLADRDTLNVTTGEFYRALRLRSSGFDIEMLNLAVRYAGGQRDLYRINMVIPSGGRTTPIDLRGERRRITALDFTYSTRVLSTQKTKLCIDGLLATRGNDNEEDEEDLEAQ